MQTISDNILLHSATLFSPNFNAYIYRPRPTSSSEGGFHLRAFVGFLVDTTFFFICLGVSALGFFGLGFRLGFLGTILAAVHPGKVCFSCVTVRS